MPPISRAVALHCLLFSTLSATCLHAQELRGTILQSDGETPAGGVVVLLLDAVRDTTLGRTVTGERGAYSVKLGKPGTVRLQLLRLGQRPTLVGSYSLTTGAAITADVTLKDNPIALANFDVKAKGGCAVRPDTGLLVAQLYEEARKALIASSTAISGVNSIASFTRYTRNEDLKGKLTAAVQRTTVTGPTSKPFVSLSADSLAKVGYVSTASDGTTYRAPDAEVLFSDIFLKQHCLQLVLPDDKHRKSIGIGFHAVNRDKKTVDVKGTLWLDRETSELQSAEFDYDGLSREMGRNRVGGEVEFTHMANGLWFVSKWSITMPQTSMQATVAYSGSLASANVGQSEEVLTGLQTIGGVVQSVKMNDEVLYASSDASFLEGEAPKIALTTMRDLATPVASTSARNSGFSADSTTAVSSCGAAVDGRHFGTVQGRIIDDAHHNVSGAVVTADWKEDFEVRTGTTLQWQQRRLTTTSLPDGSYSVCGLPMSRPVTLVATRGTDNSRSGTIRVVDGHPRTTLDLAIRAPLVIAENSHTSMVRVVDMLDQPVAHAVIALNGGTQRVTDEDGLAVVKVANADSLNLLVRRIGYAQFDGYAKQATKTEPFTVHLSPTTQTLRAVNVTAREKSPLERTGFYDRVRDIQRGAVTGEFFTPEQIEQRNASRPSQILMTSKYARIETERGWGDPLSGKQDYGGVQNRVYVHGRNGCEMTIYVDGVMMRKVARTSPNEMDVSPDERLGLDEIVVASSIRGIEIYPSGISVPGSFLQSNLTASCGIVAIWTAATR